MKLSHASTLGLAALAGLASPLAIAQVAGSGWYGGAAVGRTAATIDDARITTGLANQGLATTSIDDRDRDTGFKVFGGWQFNRNFALEAGYFDLGSFGYTATTVPFGTLGGDVRMKGVNLDLVGTLPLTGRLSALGRIGIASGRTSGSFRATGAAIMPYASANPSERSTGVKFGAGLNYDFTDSLAMRVEAERYRIGDAVGNKGNVDMVSVGLIYRFGVTPPQPRAVAPQPVFVAQAPAPAPVIAPPPPAPPPAPPPPAMPMRVALSADSLFDFDKAIVKPSGRQSLDKLAADLRGVRYDSIRVTGHTDRLGSDAYNMKLSTRRAEAVSAYLVQSGIPAGSITSRGAGESQPVTQQADCKGNKATPALVACLQPDRRVEVEVTGSR